MQVRLVAMPIKRGEDLIREFGGRRGALNYLRHTCTDYEEVAFRYNGRDLRDIRSKAHSLLYDFLEEEVEYVG